MEGLSKKEYSEAVLNYKLDNGLTYEIMAQITKIHTKSISRICRGALYPSQLLRTKIYTATGISYKEKSND